MQSPGVCSQIRETGPAPGEELAVPEMPFPLALLLFEAWVFSQQVSKGLPISFGQMTEDSEFRSISRAEEFAYRLTVSMCHRTSWEKPCPAVQVIRIQGPPQL